jgi:hypothetical protein
MNDEFLFKNISHCYVRFRTERFHVQLYAWWVIDAYAS